MIGDRGGLKLLEDSPDLVRWNSQHLGLAAHSASRSEGLDRRPGVSDAAPFCAATVTEAQTEEKNGSAAKPSSVSFQNPELGH